MPALVAGEPGPSARQNVLSLIRSEGSDFQLSMVRHLSDRHQSAYDCKSGQSVISRGTSILDK